MADPGLRIPSREDIRKAFADDDGQPVDGRRDGDDKAAPPPPETEQEDIPHA